MPLLQTNNACAYSRGKVYKVSFHEWMDSYMAGLFGRESTTLVSTVLSNVMLT